MDYFTVDCVLFLLDFIGKSMLCQLDGGNENATSTGAVRVGGVHAVFPGFTVIEFIL